MRPGRGGEKVLSETTWECLVREMQIGPARPVEREMTHVERALFYEPDLAHLRLK